MHGRGPPDGRSRGATGCWEALRVFGGSVKSLDFGSSGHVLALPFIGLWLWANYLTSLRLGLVS